MDDPWGSPWAVETPAKIDLPTAPQSAHFATDHLSPRRLSPGRATSWNDDEAWGGWNDAASNVGKESPRWGRSPGLKPMRSPSMRHLSPDPWRGVSLGGLDTGDLERGVARTRSDSERSRDDQVVDSAISLGDGGGLHEESSLKNGVSILLPPLELVVDAKDAWRTDEEKPEAPAEEHASATSVPLEEPLSNESLDELVPDVNHGLDQNRPPSRVQKLVEMYDGIAMRSVSPDIVPIVETKQPNNVEDHFEEAADVLELKLGEVPQINYNDVAHEDEDSTVEDSGLVPEEKSREPLGQGAIFEPHETERPAPKAPKPPPIPFSIDLSKLDDLFSSTKPITVEPEPVPDVIIDDTFSSSSERNAWYRMSRFGSLRKHNLGDDDNYVRVTWTGSEVRDRTIKTVRRWMEEDSITGRIVLGRRLGASGATMFNWDSSAPPVEIGELLGRNGRHSRQTSLKSPVVSPTAVSFGWTTDLPSSPTVSQHPLASEVQQTGPPKPQPTPPAPETPRHSLTLEKLPSKTSAPPPAPIQPLSIATAGKEEDDDDDWGEMVSSPTFGDSGMASLSVGPVSLNEVLHSGPQSHAGIPNKTFDDLAPALARKDTISNPASGSWGFGHFEANSNLKPSVTTPTSVSFATEPSKPTAASQRSSIEANTTITAKALVEPSISTQDLSAADEEIVASILRNLPDLSYMLR